MEEVFKVVEPSGKTYRVFADGRVEGFELGAVVFNRIPALLVSAREASRCEDIKAD